MCKKLVIVLACLLLLATVRFRVVWTEWTPPTTNTDGSPLTDLSGYNVYVWPLPSPTPGDQLIVKFPIFQLAPQYTRWPFWVGIGDSYAVQISAFNSIGVESAKTPKILITGLK